MKQTENTGHISGLLSADDGLRIIPLKRSMKSLLDKG